MDIKSMVPDSARDRLEQASENARQREDRWREKVSNRHGDGLRADRRGILQEVRIIGASMVSILLIAIVLNEVFTAVNVSSGPFSSVGTELQTTGVAAISLLIVGLIILAANGLLARFGGGF